MSVIDKYIPPQLRSQNGKPLFSSWILIIFGAMLLATVALRVIGWFAPARTIPLITPADGLVQSNDLASIEHNLPSPLPMPTDLLGASVVEAGVYTKDANGITAGSATVVLARHDWRFAELFFQPGLTLDEAKAIYTAASTETVTVGSQTALLIHISQLRSQCIPPNGDTPGFCPLSRVLILEANGYAVSIAADGDHATDGELIALARSIPQPEEKPEPDATENPVTE